MTIIYKEFAAKPLLLSRAVQLMAEDPAMTEDTAVAKVGEEAKMADAQAIQEENDALKKQVEELTAKLAELAPAAEKSVEVETELSKAKEQVTKLSAELDLASKSLKRFGVSALKLSAVSKDAPKAEVQKATPEQFSAMSPTDRNEFRAKGGLIE